MALFYDTKSRVKTLAGISEDFDVLTLKSFIKI